MSEDKNRTWHIRHTDGDVTNFTGQMTPHIYYDKEVRLLHVKFIDENGNIIFSALDVKSICRQTRT